MTPYEYHNGKLGLQISCIVSGRDAEKNSLRLVSGRTLRYRMNSDTCRENRLRLRGGGMTTLIEFDSLCVDWQKQIIAAFGKPPKKTLKNMIAEFYEFDKECFDFFTDIYREGKERKQLDVETIYEYSYNASVLNAVGILRTKRRAFRRSKGGSTRNLWESISIEVNNFLEVPHSLPVSPDGLRKKFTAYERGTYEVLVDGRRNNTNAQKVDEDMERFFNNLFAGQKYKPTMTGVYRLYESFINGYTEVINSKTGELYNPKEMKKVSESTVQNYLSKWENEIGTWQVRGGDNQKNMQRFKPHHETERPTLAGALYSIDDRQPPFWYEEGKRMWFYLGVDVASGCITTAVWGKTKEEMILEFYRQLVRNYTEWGVNLPYELEAESSLNSSYKGTFLREGSMFQRVRIEANNARGKWIERINGKLRYEHEKEEIGWIARPMPRSEANEAKTAKNIIIPYDELVQARLKNIEDYNNMPHDVKKEISKYDYFLANQDPKTKPTNWTAILPYIGYHTQSSCNQGKVILKGRKRMLAESNDILLGDFLIAKLKQVEGKTLDIYWLDANDGTVLKAIAFLNGEYMCELMATPKYQRARSQQTDQDLINYELQSAYTMTVVAFGNKKKKEIEPVLVINHKPKTVNNNFQFSHTKHFTPREEPVEVLEDLEEDMYMIPVHTERPDAQSWKDNF